MSTQTSPPRSPLRDDPGTMTCPVCDHGFIPTGRQTYCSPACRKTAFRRRHQQSAPTVTVPTAGPRREITVYECPDCGGRLLGEQRCPDCHTFARRIGLGGECPHCQEPVAVIDLLERASVTITR
jgi:Zn finger protein HypA/HybF involved in hydrogenase expression